MFETFCEVIYPSWLTSVDDVIPGSIGEDASHVLMVEESVEKMLQGTF